MNAFISQLDIQAFRGIRNLDLENLANVNVLVGANNSGKTSVLEAIRFLSNPQDMGQITNFAFLRAPISKELRSQRLVEYVSTLYHKEIDESDPSITHYSIGISANINNVRYEYTSSGNIENLYDRLGDQNKLFLTSSKMQIASKKPIYKETTFVDQKISLQDKSQALPETPALDNSLFKSLYLHASLNYYRSCTTYISEAILSNNKSELLQIIRSFDSSIQDISVINDGIYLHNKQTGAMPLFVYGMGLQKAVLLAVTLLTNASGVILIDEIDNAINMAAFKDVFPWFVKKCQELNIQTFVTTHSAEAIDAILSCKTEMDSIRIITLRKSSDLHCTIAKVRTGDEAISDRKTFGAELRV